MMRLALRHRERDALFATISLLLLSLPFVIWPQLDVFISHLFFDAQHQRFTGNDANWVLVTYHTVPWVGRIIGMAGLLVAVVAWHRPWRGGVRWWRRCLFGGLAMALVVGGLVNGVFKEQWGRARPAHTEAFGGTASFTPAWQYSTACTRNCSFVSGHAATGFVLMAFGALGSAAARQRWWLAGMAAGLTFGLARVMQGGHFASDVMIGGVLVWMSCCALRWLWLLARAVQRRRRFRWRAVGHVQPDI